MLGRKERHIKQFQDSNSQKFISKSLCILCDCMIDISSLVILIIAYIVVSVTISTIVCVNLFKNWWIRVVVIIFGLTANIVLIILLKNFFYFVYYLGISIQLGFFISAFLDKEKINYFLLISLFSFALIFLASKQYVLFISWIIIFCFIVLFFLTFKPNNKEEIFTRKDLSIFFLVILFGVVLSLLFNSNLGFAPQLIFHAFTTDILLKLMLFMIFFMLEFFLFLGLLVFVSKENKRKKVGIWFM